MPRMLADIFMAFLHESISLKGILVSIGALPTKLVHSQARIDSQTMFTKILASLALMVAVSQTALAADWQYCLAPSYREHTIYFSAAFMTSTGLGSADSSFERKLNRAGLTHDSVQCPRADDENSIMAMFQYAISYNQKLGNKIVYVNWDPTS
jgi:hypothetical protein